jgi:hypothetical protein
MSNNPLLQMEEMFNSIGTSMYQDEFACELLAWFHVFGGNNEAVVLNHGLNGALQACAKKLGIEGGSTPDARLFLIFKEKTAELEECVREGCFFPEWMVRICKRYKLRLPEEKIDFLQEDFKEQKQ